MTTKDYNHELSQRLVEKIKREDNVLFIEWMFENQIRNSRKELSRWAFQNNYK